MSTTASLGIRGFGHEVNKISELINLQLKDPLGSSFHDTYKHSCYIHIGGLDKRMTEGDVLIVFSQWGEIVDINLVRDKETGESKGFAFLAYEDQRSTVLAVDNANGMRLLNRTLKVDHTMNYYAFKETDGETGDNHNEATKSERAHGRASA